MISVLKTHRLNIATSEKRMLFLLLISQKEYKCLVWSAPPALPSECALLFVCVLSSVSAGIIWQIRITYNHGKAAESPGSETILPLCVCVFPPLCINGERAASPERTRKSTAFLLLDYGISVSPLQTGWLSHIDKITFSSLQMSMFGLAGI